MSKKKLIVYGVTGQTMKTEKVEPMLNTVEIQGNGSGIMTDTDILECQKMADECKILLPTHLNLNVGNRGNKRTGSNSIEPLIPIV